MSEMEQSSKYEHLRFNKNGSLKGLYHLDTTKAKGVGGHGYWDKIEEMIEAYTKIHPQEMVETLAYCRDQRDFAFNDFGVNNQDSHSTMRLGIALPNGLMIAIMTFDPEFLDNDKGKLTKFRKMFPGFNTSKRI